VGDPILERLGRDGRLQVVEGAYLGALADGDLFSHSYNSGGGFGDPLDRDPAAIREDIRRGFTSVATSLAINGVVMREISGDLQVDDERTALQRDQVRADRLARSMPVAEWLDGERERVRAGRFCEAVASMYSEIRALSPRWWRQFTKFWGLPDDFELPVAPPDER
jgi:hypothetical protein